MASARPSAVVMLSAKIETSVKPVSTRSTDIAPRTAIRPTTKGSIEAIAPPNTHTSTRKLSGTAIASIRSRSFMVTWLICLMMIALPPARIVMPSRSPTTGSDSSEAYSCALFSPPAKVATIRPVLPSVLRSSAAAAGGEVHGEVTLSTLGEASRRATMSVPAAVADAPVAPEGSLTVMSSC